MCGFAGGINTDINKDKLLISQDKLEHRGPDDQVIFQNIFDTFKIDITTTRLSFVDQQGGQQPFFSSNKEQLIVFNGEIYNHNDLRIELKNSGYIFKTNSDIEVALYSLIAWGEAAFSKWIGMWAFSFIDIKNKTCMLARDHFGQKPLYYTTKEGGLSFASELKPLVCLQSKQPELDNIALSQFLFFDYIPAPRTPYKEIFKLLPGEYIKFDMSSNFIKQKDFTTKIKILEKRTVEPNYLLELLNESLSITNDSDLAPAYTLSGGIDSAGLVSIAKKNGYNPIVFSMFFDQNSFNEESRVNEVLNYLNLNSINENFLLDDINLLIDEVYPKLDEPLGDSSLLPSYKLAYLISKNHKYFITGDGADELFMGYDTHIAYNLMHKLKDIPSLNKATKLIHKFIPSSHKNMNLKFKLERLTRAINKPPTYWVPYWMSNTSTDKVNEIWGTNLNTEDIFEPFLSSEYLKGNHKDIAYKQMMDIYLPNNVLMVRDRSSMLNSLEARCPYLNQNFAQTVMSIPTHLKANLLNGRKIPLKNLLQSHLSKKTINFKKKGFGAPTSFWLAKSDNSFLEKYPITTKHFFSKELSDHQDGTSNNKSILWNSLILEKMNFY